MKLINPETGQTSASHTTPQGGGGRLQGTGLPISGGLLAIVFAGALLLLREEALNPTRPTMGAPEALDAQTETVRARLWQDPFAAVARHRENDSEEAPDRPQAPAIHPGALVDPDTVVLGVMTFAGPYDEQAERRLRSRHAVLSALGEEGYVPVDSEHLGFFRYGLGEGESSPEIDVPYEWFIDATPLGSTKALPGVEPGGERREVEVVLPRQEEPSALLLLWLREGAFRHQPLVKLSRLVGIFRSERAGPKFKLLGPYGSTNLRAMAEAIDACLAPGAGCGKTGGPLSGVQIFSPSATIDDWLLPHNDAEERSLEQNRPQLLDRRFQELTGDTTGQSRFVRTIGTDRELAGALIRELVRRDVDPTCLADKKPGPLELCNNLEKKPKPAHVALISEWDTDYGRALPCAFVASATGRGYTGDCASPGAPTPAGGTTEDEAGWLHRFSYLRGFDGQLPKTPQEAARIEGWSPDAESVRSSPAERPVGRRRLDYLQRLTGQLRRLDDDLKRQNGGTGVEAIGVLGSDVYDKLLILQALREEFRHILFFTTDLDANLLHPAEYKATRNLIVVSNFGLELANGRRELADDLQGKIPAFRDGYQTSLFFSTRRALNPELENVEWWPSRIYEIGRRGAFDLSFSKKGSSDETIRSAHPLRRDHLARGLSPRAKKTIPGIAVLGLLFCLFYWRSYPVSRRSASKRRIRLTTGSLLLAGTTTLALLICAQDWKGEPFALFDGISVWPSLYLRYLVAILSLHFLLMSWRSIAQSDNDLERNFLPRTAKSESGRAELPSGEEREWPFWKGLAGLATLSGRLLRLLRVGRRLARLRFHRFHRQGPASATPGAVSAPWARTLHGVRLPIITSDLEAPQATARRLLRTYLQRSRLSRRLLRILPLSLVYFVLCRLFIVLTGEPNVPFRGPLSDWASFVITVGLAVPLLIILIFWVVDATRLSGRLTAELSSCKTRWPEATLKRFGGRLNLLPALVSEWLDIQVIARHSVAIGRLVYAPVIVIVLMIASRASYFDNWAFSPGLSLVICVSVLYSLYCGATVRRSAEDARSAALRGYHRALIQSKGADSRQSSAQIRLLIDEIANLRVGAFVPFSQQPWVRAIALLFGGGGSLVLLEYLMLAG